MSRVRARRAPPVSGARSARGPPSAVGAGGIRLFDTAEMYGNGESERRLAAALLAAGKKPGEVTVATKWNPILRTARSIPATIGARLECLTPFPIDLFQVHQPLGFSSVEAERTPWPTWWRRGRSTSWA